MQLARKYLVSGFIFILGLSISVGLYSALLNANELKRDQIRATINTAVYNNIQREIDKNLDVLYLLRSDYNAHDGFNRDQFSEFGCFFTSNIKSIQALEWVPAIKLNNRDSFELAVQEEGFSDFQIFTKSGDSILRAEERPIYYPVTFIEPYEGNEAALGFDPGKSNKTRDQTIEKAISSGQAALSNVITIIQKVDPHKAVLAFVPVYQKTDSSVIGLIEGVYLIDEILNTAIDNLDLATQIELSITATDNSEVLYGEAAKITTDFSGNLSFADRQWHLQVDYLGNIGSSYYEIQLIFIVCLLLTLIISYFTFYTINKSETLNLRIKANIESIFKISDRAIALYTLDLTLIEWNQEYGDLSFGLLGFKPSAGQPLPENLNYEDGKFIDKLKAGEKVKTIRQLKIGNEIKFFEIRYLPIFQNFKIVGISMLLGDITEIKKYEQELENYNKKLELLVSERTRQLDESNEDLLKKNAQLEEAMKELKLAQDELLQSRKMVSMGIISSGVAHEINNPLNFIVGGIRILKKNIANSNLNEDQLMAMKSIEEGARRATKIVQSLSHFSRRTTSLDEDCDINEVLDNCLVMLQSSYNEKIEVTKDYKLEKTIKGNEGSLHQGMMNILMNAEQSIDHKGKVTIATYEEDGKAIIKISDTGSGIDESQLPHIMDPFYTTKSPGDGTGLGLFITYNIINDHRGSIQFESVKNEGTTCTITLKL